MQELYYHHKENRQNDDCHSLYFWVWAVLFDFEKVQKKGVYNSRHNKLPIIQQVWGLSITGLPVTSTCQFHKNSYYKNPIQIQNRTFSLVLVWKSSWQNEICKIAVTYTVRQSQIWLRSTAMIPARGGTGNTTSGSRENYKQVGEGGVWIYT
jgi:hypothetical protein